MTVILMRSLIMVSFSRMIFQSVVEPINLLFSLALEILVRKVSSEVLITTERLCD